MTKTIDHLVNIRVILNQLTDVEQEYLEVCFREVCNPNLKKYQAWETYRKIGMLERVHNLDGQLHHAYMSMLDTFHPQHLDYVKHMRGD